MGDKETDDEQPELNITDDLHESVSATEETSSSESPEPVEEVIPVVETEMEPATVGSSTGGDDGAKPSLKTKLAAFLKTRKGKIVAVIAALLLLSGVLLAIPTTRYAIMGVFVKKDVTLTVVDQDSSKPVSGATVTLGTYMGKTDANGKVMLTAVPVGQYQLKVEKKYYTSSSSDYLVPILSAPEDTQPRIQATGRNVQITVTNNITGAKVANASITVSDSTAVSNEQGVADIILPVKTDAQQGVVKADGYNDAKFEVTVDTSDDQKLAVPLTSSGKVFFLSKRTGKIDVMKSDLDGGNAEVVLAGTGKESDTETVLLSTTDWRYLALHASRDSDKPKLYLIDASSGKLSTMDEGDASFQLIGWSGHQFVYTVTRGQEAWVDKRQALKSYNAETAKLATLDETQGSGTNYYDFAGQNIGNVYAIDDVVTYTKVWELGQYVSAGDRKTSIMTVGLGGSNKKSLKDFSPSEVAYIDAKLYDPGEVYYRAASRTDNTGTYYEYDDGKITETADTNDQKFYNSFYATYLISPSGKKTLWYEPRDGKNVIFVGDASGNNGREVGVSDYTPYGWYSDDYILLSQKGSELYIFGEAGKIDADTKPLKITDYHKPALTYPGYGGGYGGQ